MKVQQMDIFKITTVLEEKLPKSSRRIKQEITNNGRQHTNVCIYKTKTLFNARIVATVVKV